MTAPEAGVVLAGRYRLLDRVAVGAMGEVWRAHDDLLDREVAVKVLRPELAEDDDFVQRFRGEARHAASVRHPRVAAVHDYGEDPEVSNGGVATAYLVMELLTGRPLSEVLQDGGPLPSERVAALLAQVADALGAAHRIGVVHRDVKPANLVVSDPDADGTEDVTVTDFGIARAADAVPVTRTGLVMGTAEYLSPEQARGARATTASDVYSLGVVAYELLTGTPPFTHAAAASVARAHVHDDVPPLPDEVPSAMRGTVLRCLVKDPAQRPTVRELALRLHDLAAGTAVDDPAWAATAVGGSGARAAGASAPAGGSGAQAGGAPAQAGSSAQASGSGAPTGPSGKPAGAPAPPARTDLPPLRPTATVPVVPARRILPGRRRRRLRSPLVALIALLALLLLASVLQSAGLLSGAGALPDVTRSPLHTIDEDGI